MKVWATFCIGLLTIGPLWQLVDHDLVKVKVTRGISVMLPKDFQPMDSLDLNQKYPSARSTIGAYTNPDRTVDFMIRYSATRWPDADTHLARLFFKSSLENLFDAVDMIHEGIHEVNGKQYIFFEFEYKIAGQQGQLGLEDAVINYSYLQYLIEPDKTLVFAFSCPRHLRPQWEETADKIMNSLRIR